MEVSTLDRPTTTADPVTEALTRVLDHYTGTPAITVPDGYSLERIGQNWSVGPADSDTHLIVTDLSQVPAAIDMFDAMVARAARLEVTR